MTEQTTELVSVPQTKLAQAIAEKAGEFIPGTGMNLALTASTLMQSGFLGGKMGFAQLVTKMMIGRAMDIDPITAIQEINFFDGKILIGVGVRAAKVKRSGYKYRVTQHTERICSITYFQDGEEVGVSTFTIEDATRAQLVNKPIWKSYPKNMLFARAMANGQRMYAPEAFGGIATYDPDEMSGMGSLEQTPAVTLQEQVMAVSRGEKPPPQEPVQDGPDWDEVQDGEVIEQAAEEARRILAQDGPFTE